MTHFSKEGTSGYPGTLLVTIVFDVTRDNEFIIDIKARSSGATPVNITDRLFLNLAGHVSWQRLESDSRKVLKM